METPVLVAVVAAVAVAALVAVGALILALGRERARARRETAAARAEAASLRARLDALADDLEELRATREREQAFLITDAGVRPEPTVSNAVVLSATVGEPLVKAMALGHGLRRALAPESRDRIRSAVRREVRRQRKQRRREMKEAWRRTRVAEKSRDQADLRAADAA